jgi:hypothetical protein
MPATVSTINAGPALTYTTFDLLNPDDYFYINSIDWTSGSRYFVDAVFLTLTGGKLDTDPYLTMSDWYQTNRKAIKGNKVEDALQYGPFGLAVEVFTRANFELTPTGALGWGYIHPAANIWS